MPVDVNTLVPASEKAKNVATEEYVDTEVSGNILENISSNNDDFAIRMGYADYADMTADYANGNTVIEGGFINAGMIQAQAITAQHINTDNLVAESIKGDTVLGSVGTGSGIRVRLLKNNIHSTGTFKPGYSGAFATSTNYIKRNGHDYSAAYMRGSQPQLQLNG